MSTVIDLNARRSPPHPGGRPEVVPDEGRAVYTVREVARLLSLSLGGTYELVRSGVIPALRVGGRWIIPKQRFHAWLDSCTEHPHSGLEAP